MVHVIGQHLKPSCFQPTVAVIAHHSRAQAKHSGSAHQNETDRNVLVHGVPSGQNHGHYQEHRAEELRKQRL
jgi:hypothetical protein